jgi:cytochrome d ubiquinol oxidase subunit I
MIAKYQPGKFAASEGLGRTTAHAPEALFGYYSGGKLHDAIKLPDGLSILDKLNPGGTVRGLDSVPADDRPPLVTVVHLSFDVMVLIGFGLLLLGAWLAWSWWRKRDIPGMRLFLWATALSGVGAVVAMECGWIVTEVGRQPWIVYNVLKVANAVNPEPGVQDEFWAVAGVYAVLTVVTIAVLRRLTRSSPVPAAPQETDVEEYHVV